MLAVQCLRRRVVVANLEEHLAHPPIAGLGEQNAEQRATQALTARGRRDADRLDVALLGAARGAEAGVTDQAGVGLGDDVVLVRGGELVGHLPARPGVAGKQQRLELHDRVEVVGSRAPHLPRHPVTRFGVESVTSGARR